MRHFFDEPGREFSIRELAKIWRVAPATAAARLAALEREGLVRHREFRRAHLYAAASTRAFKLAKRHDLLQRINEALLPLLNEAYWDPVIVLFGSGARGEDVDEIDLLVLSEEREEIDLRKAEAFLHRRIDLFLHRTLSDIPNDSLIYNILNGITIQGDATWISESVRRRSGKSRRTGNERRASARSAMPKRASLQTRR